MNITRLIETLLFPPIGGPGPGLPDPPTAKKAVPVKVEKAGGRLVNAQTMTYEWDIARSRPANKPAELTDVEVAELEKRGLKNMTWNACIKLARVQGRTIAEAAKDAGCGFSTAQKVYAALSKFE